MTEFLLRIVAHPVGVSAIVLSVGAAIGCFIFFAGVFSSGKHLFQISMSEEHLTHVRTRAMWGVVLMSFFFLLWETVRVTASFFSGESQTSLAYLVGGVWGFVLCVYLIKKAFGGAPAKKH